MHPLLLRLSFLSAAVAITSYSINRIVPEPYLDEAFHIPQALAYCRDAFDVWDPKLTTPAGLYLLSYPLSFFDACTPSFLRAVNAFGVAVPLPVLIYRIQQAIHGRRGASTNADNAQTALNVALFPLLYFFGGLYYTDVWSTIFVLAAYLATLKRSPWAAAVFAWLSLWFRQTNVVWTVFIAAGWLVTRLQEVDAGVYNPPISAELVLGDFISTPPSLLLAALRNPVVTLNALAPFLIPLTSFLAFLITNNFTIVLGDASAHVASLHLPQLLYFTGAVSFFSWPLLLPILPSLRPTPTKALSLTLLAAFLAAAIKYNTILHPYLLADNRHYTFYVFRRVLLRLPFFLPVPAYVLSLWLQLRAATASTTAAWMLLFGAATAATLVSAPLVEPRYFITAWTLWRCHVSVRGRWLWVEAAWYAAVGAVTIGVFLARTFEWPGEEARMRFMW